ncbi:hypothetical protein ABPG74_019129 [Tetrahymena malaccensis]
MQNQEFMYCLILYSLIVVAFAGTKGIPVGCKYSGAFNACQINCIKLQITGGNPSQCTWNGIAGPPSCYIADCDCLNQPGKVISGLYDEVCYSCKGNNSSYFMNSLGTSCVASSASCDTSLRKNAPWTTSDCGLCNPEQPALLNGQCVSCDKITSNWTVDNCIACNPSSPAVVNGVCTACNSISSGWTDENCKSCAGGGKNIFAKSDGSTCIASSASCTTANRQGIAWTAADCLACSPTLSVVVNGSCIACSSISSGWTDENCKSCAGGGKNIFAKSDGSTCIASSASCTTANRQGIAWTTADCLACSPSLSVVVNGSCIACSSISSGWTDENCKSCAGGGKNIFAKSDGSACIASSASCTTANRQGIAWTAADCLACSPSSPAVVNGACTACNNISSGWTDENCKSCAGGGKNIFAKSDGSACIASSASCTTANRQGIAWTAGDCQLCSPTNSVVKSDGSSCIACNSITSGWTDENCKSCALSASPVKQNIFAKADGSSCVAAQYSCNKTARGSNKWNDSDCALCNGDSSDSKKYASLDGSQCLSTNPSAASAAPSSSYSCYTFISALLVLSALLI